MTIIVYLSGHKDQTPARCKVVLLNLYSSTVKLIYFKFDHRRVQMVTVCIKVDCLVIWVIFGLVASFQTQTLAFLK